jgi:hypothetical protein
MGYFDSQEEAEKILDLVRDVYPAAWAGAAPGIKLRARAALPEPATAETPVAAAPVASPPPVVPPAAPVAVAPTPAVPAAPPVTVAAKPAPALPATVASVAPVKLELAPDLPRAKPQTEAPAKPAGHDATSSLSDVRATIAALSDAPDAAAPVAAAAATPAADGVLEGAAVLRLLTSARPAPAARLAPVVPQAKRKAVSPSSAKAPQPKAPEPSAPQPGAQPEAAVFAVQLLWSVQPIDMTQVPQLAIFSAYTLYGAEGNRGGRRWYGLRLGFFTDAVSAKQVAQYVRSEFSSVSVVPVTERERERAGAAAAKPLPAVERPKSDGPELNFINDVSTDTATSGSMPALVAGDAPNADGAPVLKPAVVAALGMGTKATPGKRAKLRNGAGAKPPAKRPLPNRPLSLEETLEILGAGELQIESTKRRDLLSESAVRDRRQPEASTSRFGRLINRLAERFGNS